MVVLVALTACDPTLPPEPPKRGPMVIVTRVIDGDTVEIEDGRCIRLIGVDTPEVYGGAECYGPEASAFTERRLEGETVRLEFDKDRTDQYGRTLAYVWTESATESGRLFNRALVAQGLATVTFYEPNDGYQDRPLCGGGAGAGCRAWSVGFVLRRWALATTWPQLRPSSSVRGGRLRW
jgi:endonuclease YncB( thermonuclease family)